MICNKERSRLLKLTVVGFFIYANVAFSEEAAVEEDVEDVEIEFPITSPTSRNSLSAEILMKMRTNLMVVMGIEPEEAEATKNVKSKSH